MTATDTANPVAPGTPVQLESARFIARSMTAADASGPYRMWIASDVLMNPLNMPGRRLPPDVIARQISGFDNNTRYLIGLFSKSPREQIGVLLGDVNAPHRLGKITLFIGNRNWWGKGVFEEIGTTLLDHFFAARGIEKISAQVNRGNIPVRATLTRMGFKVEGKLRQEIRKFDGSGRIDQTLYGLLASEWPQARKRAIARNNT